jgi:transcriptional antiterminator RfaH
MTMKQWYAVHTRVGREQEAQRRLQDQDLEVYLPMMLQRIAHARRITWQPRPFLPGYLFLHLSPDQCRWTSIRSTRGVVGPVRFGTRCPVIDAEIIARFRHRENADGHIVLDTCRPESPFTEGQRVRVLDGAMADLEGVFLCKRGEERALLFMQLLQRRIKVTVDISRLAAA